MLPYGDQQAAPLLTPSCKHFPVDKWTKLFFLQTSQSCLIFSILTTRPLVQLFKASSFSKRTFTVNLNTTKEKKAPELTEQNHDAEQDGHQCPSAKPRLRRESLRVAQLHVALAVAGAHSDGERVGAAQCGKLSVGNDHRNVVDAPLQAAVAAPPGQNPGRVV